MKSFVMVLTLFLFSVPLAGQAEDLSAKASQEGSSISAQQAAITARFAAVNTIESRFTQEKHMALLDKPVTSEGLFYFEKPGRIRWQYTKPFQNGFLIDGKKTYRLEKDQKEEQKNPMAYNLAAQLLAWLTFDLETLSKQYSVQFTPQGVILTPLKEGFISQITVTFSATNPQALSRVEIAETGGDKTVLRFINPKTNQKLPAEAFK